MEALQLRGKHLFYEFEDFFLEKTKNVVNNKIQLGGTRGIIIIHFFFCFFSNVVFF